MFHEVGVHMGKLGSSQARIKLSGGSCWDMIFYGFQFLQVLWIEALKVFILIVFPLMFVYKKALEYRDTILLMGGGQICLLHRKIERSPSNGKGAGRYVGYSFNMLWFPTLRVS